MEKFIENHLSFFTKKENKENQKGKCTITAFALFYFYLYFVLTRFR